MRLKSSRTLQPSMASSVYGQEYKGIVIKADCRVHEQVANHLQDQKINNHEILDIACGNGALSQRIKDLFPSAVIDTNDIEKEKIKFAQHRNQFQIDLDRKVNIDNKYDFILAIEIIEHLGNPFHLLSTAKDLLKDKGQIIVSTPDIDSIYDRLFFLRTGRVMYFTDEHYHESGHISPISRWQMNFLCERLGLKIKKVIRVPWRVRFLRKLVTALFLLPFIPFMKNIHQNSINIFIIEK